MRSAAWIVLLLSGMAAAQRQDPAPSIEPYRLGPEETARRALFCANVYAEVAAKNGNPKIKEPAAANAKKATERAAKLVSGETHALLARIAKDSFLEQMDGATRSGGFAEVQRALSEFQTDCARQAN